ncbi:class I SAM-dependent methyltransferase [bacterium]|nr:class I SAM-dependent methyltransferase [candidate division CSSED10-310 bacterium]
MKQQRTVPPPIASGIRAAHERISPHYGLTDLDGIIPSPSYQHWNMDRRALRPMHHFASRLPSGADAIFLDAGCGNGQFSQIYLAWGVPSVLGADFATGMLETALERSVRNGYEARFDALQTELGKLALRDDCIHGAHLFGVIEHLDDPRGVLAELVRVLVPGGLLLFSVPRRWSIPFFDYLFFGQSPLQWGSRPIWRDYLRFRGKLRYYRFFSRRAVDDLLAGIPNAEVVERQGFAFFHVQGFPFAPLHWLAGRRGGYRLLDSLDTLFRVIWPWPGAEYLVLRKVGPLS